MSNTLPVVTAFQIEPQDSLIRLECNIGWFTWQYSQGRLELFDKNQREIPKSRYEIEGLLRSSSLFLQTHSWFIKCLLQIGIEISIEYSDNFL